jgi:tryptophanyl-tRNA synthetase
MVNSQFSDNHVGKVCKTLVLLAYMKKVMVSGIQPSGIMHIGNYFGAIKQLVDLQNEYDSRIIIVDLHAMTTVQDKEKLSRYILNVAMDYLACGLDPKNVTLFKQSDLPEVTELTWYFNCITTMAFLERATTYKDAHMKAKEVTVGLFDYPMLMCADILIHDADIVPVGQDQKQHVEYARDTAQKFNNIYGDTFKLPEVVIKQEVAIVPGTDGRKMSKSYGNTIPLFGTDEEIKKAVMSIVTDSGGAIPTNVYEIHKLFRPEEDLQRIYAEKNGKYKDLKEMLAEDIIQYITPMRDKRKMYEGNLDLVRTILKEGGEKIKALTKMKVTQVRSAVGVTI